MLVSTVTVQEPQVFMVIFQSYVSCSTCKDQDYSIPFYSHSNHHENQSHMKIYLYMKVKNLCNRLVVRGHFMTSTQDVTSRPSPPSSCVILQSWRWCQRWDPVSHRRRQWQLCNLFTVLFSPELRGTMRPLSRQGRETADSPSGAFLPKLVCELKL